MPLGFALNATGVSKTGLYWSSARGTVLNGTMVQAQYGAQPIGTVHLNLQLAALLKGKLRYATEWNGAAGQGTGVVDFGRSTLDVSDASMVLHLRQLVGLIDDVRQTDGSVSIRDASVTLSNGKCANAQGSVSSDVLTKFAARYDQQATAFTGTLACDGPMLLLDMAGQVGINDMASAQLRVGTAEASSLEARVKTIEPEIATALLFYGFETDGDEVIFRREAQTLVEDVPRIGLPAQRLSPGECGLFFWSKTDVSQFVFFMRAAEPSALFLIDEAPSELSLTSTGGTLFEQFFTEMNYLTNEGQEIALDFAVGEALEDGHRLPSGRISYADQEGWRTVLPIIGVHACQPVFQTDEQR